FAHRVYCPACRTRLTCPNCNVGLVVHTAIGQSICHYCRSRVVTPTVCPNVTCGEKLVQVGLGTQRVESILAELFPKARMQRVDSDTMSHRTHYQRIVDDFEARRIDVLVGTQMIAKGLHLPRVTVVGVVNADVGLHLPDFRAGERTFQLLCQVAGRAGRGEREGRVVIQTYTPEHYAIQAAATQDYRAFYQKELSNRRLLQQPPFVRLAQLLFAHTNEAYSFREAARLATDLKIQVVRGGVPDTQVLGPAPAHPPRVKGRFRWHIVVRGADPGGLLRDLSLPSGWSVDIDPISVL
ncbi:MAG: primosomal protein N', partial [Chloroflexi bacterium]|nr:primosomal protein N' [Chloroflexota bacterium]